MPFHRLALTLGASAAAATYLTWRLTSDNNRIALDSPQAGKVSTSKAASPAGTSSRSTEASSSGSASTATTEVTAPHQPESAPAAQDGGQKAADSEPDATNGGAFNPETGEINWDCPCLGGMAHGPCGLEFREAFSCFVYSEAEPKGMDCVEKFKAMQDCFRAHPDVYADEIADDEEDGPPTTNEGPTAEDEKDQPLAIQAQTEIPLSDAPGSPTSTASS